MRTHIHRFQLGQMQANCYLLEQEGKCMLIDPVDSADFLLEEIQRRKLELIGMIATHGHFDHVMAAGEVQLSYPLPLYLHPQDRFLVNRLAETATHFLGYDPQVIQPTLFHDITTEPVHMGPFTFEVLYTPGHTPGSVSLYLKEEQAVFVGDVIFMGSVGRYDFSYSDKEELKRSIGTILALPEETTIYSGHGEETTVQFERGWEWEKVL